MKLIGITILVVLVFTPLAVAATKPAAHNQYGHTSSAPHYSGVPHSSAGLKPGNVKGLPHSTASNAAAVRGSVGTYNSEVLRLEHATGQLQARSTHSPQRASGRAPAAHSESSGRASGINFSYRAPQAGGGRVGSHHH